MKCVLMFGPKDPKYLTWPKHAKTRTAQNVAKVPKGKAELFGGEPGLRGVDYIFEANNSVLVAAAATGLKQSPGQMTSGMTIEAMLDVTIRSISSQQSRREKGCF